jgi:hypothetical protein
MQAALSEALDQLHGIEWDKELGTIPCLAHVLQIVVNTLIKALKIEASNETLPTSFDEDDIVKVVEQIESMENTLQKVCL